jgi:hypothetical protein
MILEVAILDVKAGQAKAFEAAFGQASNIISSMSGYVSHELQRCIETPNRYILLVQWQTLEDHTMAFGSRRNTKLGGSYCITFMSRFQLSSTTKRFEKNYSNPNSRFSRLIDFVPM